MDVSFSLFSGFNKVSTVPAGNASKASLVGANTVNGPLLSNVGTSPAAFTAATKVVWSLEFMAFSTIFFVGYMAAPPTIFVWANVLVDNTALRINNPKILILFILIFLWLMIYFIHLRICERDGFIF